MDFNFHIYLHHDHGEAIEAALKTNVAVLSHINTRITTMSTVLDALKAQVAANTDIVKSAIVFVQGLKKQLQDLIDAGADPVALQALADELHIQDQALAESIVVGTAAAAGTTLASNAPGAPAAAVVQPASTDAGTATTGTPAVDPVAASLAADEAAAAAAGTNEGSTTTQTPPAA